MKWFTYAIGLALCLGLGVFSAWADDPQWTLATDDTILTLSVSSNRLLLTSLLNPARGWNWLAAPTGFPLVATANAAPLTWQYTNATYATNDGQKLTLRFTCASPALVLISEWWARPGRGPVRHAMSITNVSGSTATISYQPSLYLPVVGDGQLSTWYVHSDGGTPDATGLYNNTISGSYSTNLETRSEGFFIPFAALTVTNGHGVYVGTEWSAARTYIQGGSTTNALLEATGYQEGRSFTYALANNATFVVPPALVGAYAGDRDAAGNSLRKYLWDYSMPAVVRTNSAYPTVQWNAYYAMSKNTPYVYDTVQTKWAPFVDQIAPLGFEEIMHDVGWNATMTSPLCDAVDWPFGMKVSFDYAKSKGLRCGLYLAGPQSYANIKYLFDTYGAQSWRSDGTAGYALGSPTATTYAEVLSFYQMLDALQADLPEFEFENCNGGGRIKDFGAMKRSTKIFYTDTYTVLDSQQTFFDSSHLFPAVQLLSSLVDRPVGVAGTLYAWRTAALGAPGGFGDSPAGLNGEWTMVFATPPRTHHGGVAWTAAEKQAVAATLAVYKNRVRPLQRDSDLYHLTSRPDGTQWYAIQYFKPTLKQGVAYIFRPDSPSASQHFTLKGLNAAADYVLTFADGSNPTTIRSGAGLMSIGIDVTLATRTNSDWMFFAEGVALTQPAEATVYNAPGTIPLEAVAVPTNGSISRVEFYAGTNLLQTVTAAASGTVYSCVASNVAAGSYLLTAKVYTNGMLSGVSAPVGVRVNALPSANTNDYSVVKNTILTVAAPGVLDNDSDPDGDTLTAILASNPLHGSVSLQADGSFSYTPTNSYSGADAFTYQITDGWATSTPTTVTITVLATGAMATGGTVVSYMDAGGTNWTAHIFTNAGTNTLTFSAPGSVEYLIVGGGGGGGDGGGGGGGGGGGIVKTGSLQVVVGDYQVVVGGGGLANTNGVTSSLHTVSASGGGYGGAGGTGANCGNGGGGAGGWGSGSSGYAGGAGTDGGKTGGKGYTPNDAWPKCGGGGAGMGTNGTAATGSGAGAGGNGVASSITGASVTYGGGGGGGARIDAVSVVAAGGAGGGGDGGVRPSTGTIYLPVKGTDGLGGGGGGGGGNINAGGNPSGTQTGAAGGSGIVIVRYRTTASEGPTAILTSVSSVSVPEGSTNTFGVRLSSQPTSDVTVAVAWTAGDSDISVTGGVSLTFTTNNWATYQTVTLAAAEDGDTTNGTATITCSSSQASSVIITAIEADNDPNLIAVNDPSLYWSRDNVYVSGTSFASLVVPGAYLKTAFTGTAITITIDLSAFVAASVGASDYPLVRYQVDGGAWVQSQFTATTSNVVASGLSSGSHSFRFEYVANTEQTDNWNTPVNPLKITGITLDPGAVLSAPALCSKALRVDGDSITQGIRANLAQSNPSGNRNYLSYAYLVAASLNAELTQLGYGAQGWSVGGSGNIPNYPGAVDLYYSGISRVSGGVLAHSPDYWLIVHGQNDVANNIQAAVQTGIGKARTEAGSSCQLFVVVPFSGTERANVTAGYNAYAGANPSDTRVHLIDLGSISYTKTDGVHPDAAGHQTIAAALVAAINAVITNTQPTLTVQATDPVGRTINGDQMVFTVYRPVIFTNESLIVNYTLGGTAVQGTDYSIAPASGAATFAPDTTNVAITVTPVYKADSQKSVVLTLATGAYAIGAMNSATGTLAAVELSVSARQMKITFGGYTNRSETLTNFPVLVTLSNNVGGSGFRYDDFLSTNGCDLRFVTNLTDATSLNYEIESWNTNGASCVWIQVPTLPGDGSGAIWATWGNAVTSNRLACTTNGATWDATFAAVWHLQRGTMLAVRDSTTNAYAGTSSNNPVSVTGKIGGAGDFDGGNPNGAFVATGFNPSNSLANKFTVRAWVYPRATGNYKGVAGSHGTPNYSGIEFLQWITDHWDANVGNGTVWASSSASVPLVVSNWNDVAVVWSSDGSTLTTTAYVDGGQKDLKTTSSFGNIAHVTDFRIGRAHINADRCFNGMIDELRVSRVARSANWVWAENLTMASNTVFSKYGAMQTPGAVPAAPTGLTATAAATNQINLSWADQATNETGYVVSRSLDSDAWVLVVVTSANATNTSDSGLTTNTLYYYRVAASNAAGLSAYCFATGMTWSTYEAWRQTQFDAVSLTNSAISGDTADPDHDGLYNEQEFQAGTDPTNASSSLVLYAPTNNAVAEGAFVVHWQSVAGKHYAVQAATNLIDGFSNLVAGVLGTPPINVLTDNVGSVVRKYYRVAVE